MSIEMNAEEYIASKDRLVVDFWAEWCGPCKTMNPIVEELSKQVTVLKVDADANTTLTRKYNVLGIPTVIYFENGEEKARSVGAKPLAQLAQELGIE